MLTLALKDDMIQMPEFGRVKAGKESEWIAVHRRADPNMLGFIPIWLDPANLEPACVQLDKNYKHGGGYTPFEGFTLRDDLSIVYPGDPPHLPLWLCQFREEEWIIMYPHAWVMILNPKTKEFVIARMD